MRGVVTAFTGIRKRDELTQLVHLIHFMGGSIRKEMNSKATHLICSNAYGDKYRYALTFRLNVVRSSWVFDAWRNRDATDFSAKSEPFTVDLRRLSCRLHRLSRARVHQHGGTAAVVQRNRNGERRRNLHA
jgi:hypothetical protein